MPCLEILPCVAGLTAARRSTSDDAVDFGRGLTKDACFLIDSCDLASVEDSSK